MKIKYLFTVVAMIAITQHSFAQFSEDAVRFSQSQYGSTARIKAIGNAQTAIGGDLSNISGNPAGIGFYTKSEASFTPEFNGSSIKATYFGQQTNSNNNNLNFNNASAVFYSRMNTPAGTDKGKGWLSVNFGASYNRSANYYENISYKGSNPTNSITNYYADLANKYGVDFNGSNLQDDAYNHYLIDAYYINPADHSKGTTYKSNVFGSTNAPNKPVNQLDNLTREGGQTNFSFSVGANYSNQFYLGAGVDISSIRYNLSRTFSEAGLISLVDNSNNPYTANYSSDYSQLQSTTGTGFSARAGFIYKPVEFVRIGGMVTTPTWYTMQDDFTENLQTAYSGNASGTIGFGPVETQSTYSFHTPWKLNGGIAVFIGKSGFITGDIEYIDYSSIRLSSGDGYSSADPDNHDIRTFYRSTANAHVGGELKLDQLYLRAGYGVQGNPLKSVGTSTNTISGGLGYRFLGYYVDLTYANVNGTQQVSPYTTITTLSPSASLNKTTNNVFLTFGFRF